MSVFGSPDCFSLIPNQLTLVVHLVSSQSTTKLCSRSLGYTKKKKLYINIFSQSLHWLQDARISKSNRDHLFCYLLPLCTVSVALQIDSYPQICPSRRTFTSYSTKNQPDVKMEMLQSTGPIFCFCPTFSNIFVLLETVRSRNWHLFKDTQNLCCMEFQWSCCIQWQWWGNYSHLFCTVLIWWLFFLQRSHVQTSV